MRRQIRNVLLVITAFLLTVLFCFFPNIQSRLTDWKTFGKSENLSLNPVEISVESTQTTLEKLKIPYEQVDNDPASSMEECAEVDKAIGTEIRKNVFLCNQKKTTFFLLVMPADKAFDTSSFSKKLGVSHMSFAPPEKMLEHLGTTPGSASVAGLLTDEDDYVQVIIDKEVAEAEWFGCNPGINTSHLKFKTKDLLQKYLPAIHHRARIVDL